MSSEEKEQQTGFQPTIPTESHLISDPDPFIASLQGTILDLTTVLDQTGNYIFTKDAAGRYTYVNQNVQDLFGASSEDIIGKDDSHFFDLTVANELRLNDRLVIEHGEPIEREEKSVVKSTGETRYYWSVKKPMRNGQGRIVGLCGICTDITERKAMEEALRKSESRLRLCQSSGGIGVWEADLVNNRLMWSDGCAAFPGFPVLNNPTWDDFLALVHPDDRQRMIDAVRTHIDSGAKFDVDYRLITADGGIQWLRSTGQAERDADGNPAFMRGIVQDAAGRKQAEAKIAKSLSLLSATLESTNDAILVVDLDNNWVLHNQRFVDLWHLGDEIIAAKDDRAALAYVLDQVEDAEAFLAKVQKLYATPEASSIDRLKFKNGQIIERYSVPQYIDGKVAGRVWSFRDITDYMRAIQALARECEKNIALLRNVSDGIHILDSNGILIDASDSFCAMLGYRRNEMIGMHVSRWDSLFADSEYSQAVWRQLSSQARTQFQSRHRRKDGTMIDVEVSSSPLELDGRQVLIKSSRDITDRVLFEDMLRKKERYQRALLDNFPFAVWLKDTESNFLSVNAGFVRIFGANNAEELVGKNDFDIAPPDLAESYRADDREVLASRRNKNVEELIFTAGARKWFETYKAPVIDDNGNILGTVGFARDIDERKRAEESLRKSRVQLKIFIYQAPISIAMFDRDMNYLATSGRWLDDYGQGHAVLTGRNYYQTHPDTPEAWKRLHQQALSGATLKKDEDLWRKPDGSQQWLRWAIAPWTDTDGEIGGIIISIEDISDRKQIQSQLAEQTEQLRETSRRKDEFLAMLAHELRNPLAPILNAVQILKLANADPARIAWCNDVIDRQVEHLVRLVDDLLDVSRISRGQVELKKELLEIKSFIQPAVETSQPLIDARRQTFRLTLPPEPLWVEGDRVRLAQVISNLLNNAAKYTEEGGHIGLSAEQAEDQIRIRVYDSGRGIDPADLSHLFDLFYQADRNLDRSQGGLGIGLSIVHNLVAMHGGDVRAFSEGRGKGSEFVVRLPRLTPPALPAASATATAAPIPGKLCILVVDDNLDAADSLTLLLETEGRHVLTAYDAQTALEIARAKRPDVIVLDIGLPGMDGYAVARALRRSSGLGQTLLIALTGYGQPGDRQKSLAAGFDEHMVKPVDIGMLRKLLADYQATGFHGSA